MEVFVRKPNAVVLGFDAGERLLLDALLPDGLDCWYVCLTARWGMKVRLNVTGLSVLVERLSVRVYRMAGGQTLHEWTYGAAHRNLHDAVKAVLVELGGEV